MTKSCTRNTLSRPAYAARNGEVWSKAEDHFVLEHADYGTSKDELLAIAADLGRTVRAVRTRHRELRYQQREGREARAALATTSQSGISAATLRGADTPQYKTPDLTWRAVDASIKREQGEMRARLDYLNETGARHIRHEAMSVEGQEGRYVPFWERDKKAAQCMAEAAASRRDGPDYAKRLERAHRIVGAKSRTREMLINAVRAVKAMARKEPAQ